MSEVNKGGDTKLFTYKITLNFKLNQNYQKLILQFQTLIIHLLRFFEFSF